MFVTKIQHCLIALTAIFLYICNMGTIGTIASVVAAVFVIIAYWNSKPVLLRRISRKEKYLDDITQEMFRLYGMNNQRHPLSQTPLDHKKEKLQQQIERLKSYL